MFGKSLLAAAALALVFAPAGFAAEKTWGYLGIYGEDATGGGPKGAVVREVVDDSPAAKAGLKVGDVIVAVNDNAVENYDVLASTMQGYKAGEKVAMKIWRDGKEETVSVTLGERPKEPVRPKTPFDFGPGGFRFRIPGQPDGEAFQLPEQFKQLPPMAKRPMIGIQLQKIDETLRQRLKLGDVQGVLIADVVPNSPAAKAQLASTDVITEVDGTKVDDPKKLSEIISAKKVGDSVALKVVREGKTLEKKVVVEEMAPAFGQRMFRYGPVPEQGGPVPFEQFHQFFPNAEKMAEMQKRIDALEKKVQDLSHELETLKAKPVHKAKPEAAKDQPKNT